MARARERRQQEMADASKDEQVQVLDHLATGTPPAAPQNSTTDEPQAPAKAAAPAAAVDGAAPAGEIVDGIKLSVYGEELVVSEADVRAAGIQTLQKERAAEYRLQEAAKTEARLRKYHEDLDAFKATLVDMQKNLRAGKAPTAQDAATIAALPKGAPAAVDDAKLADVARKAAEAIYRGDPAETAKALQSLLADVAQGRTATPPPVDVNAVAQAAADMVDKRSETRTVEEKRAAVNKAFATEFKAVNEHPEAFLVAQARFSAMLADPSNEGKPWEDIAREAGKAALHRYPELKSESPSNVTPPAPTPAVTPPVDVLAQRRELKGRTVVRQPSTSARAPAPQPPQPRSNKQYVADLRTSRGLPPAG